MCDTSPFALMGGDVRAAIFIDGGYFDKVLQMEFGTPKVSYGRLSEEIAGKLGPSVELLRTYYYHCLPYQSSSPTPEERVRYSERRKFYWALERLPRYEVRYGELARRGPNQAGQYRFVQKLTDVLLSVDLVRLAASRQITHAALIAGDSDFIPAISAAKDSGVLVCLVHGSRIHDKLWMLADERIRITQALIDAIPFEAK